MCLWLEWMIDSQHTQQAAACQVSHALCSNFRRISSRKLADQTLQLAWSSAEFLSSSARLSTPNSHYSPLHVGRQIALLVTFVAQPHMKHAEPSSNLLDFPQNVLAARLDLCLPTNTTGRRILNMRWGPFSIDFAIEILEFAQTLILGIGVNDRVIMPTQEQLVQHGRSDLAELVVQYGGYADVSRRLGMDQK